MGCGELDPAIDSHFAKHCINRNLVVPPTFVSLMKQHMLTSVHREGEMHHQKDECYIY